MSDYAVVEPSDGETIEEYTTISDDEFRAAIGAADTAYKSRRTSSTVAQRAALVRRVGDLHKERAEELAKIIVREMGSFGAEEFVDKKLIRAAP
jgi:succinate-semialdehyde dehydrogenase/glutarate-semialdehyde dehydrogenase